MRLFKKIREICIIGLGRFGSAIAEQLLCDRDNNIRIALIDKDEKHLLPFKNEVDSIYIADSAERKALESLNIDQFDAVIVATSDNIEVVAALVEIGVKKIIARATSKRHANVLKQIGVNSIISPEEEAGKRVALIVANPSFTANSEMIAEIQDGYVTGTVAVTNPSIIDKKIRDIGFRNKHFVSVELVKRGSESFLPDGEFIIKSGDLLTFVGMTENVTKVFEFCTKK